MSITSELDWDGLRRAGRIVHLALDALEQRVRPGVTTAELDTVAAGVLAAHGARSAPALVYGFPATALISVNDEIVHGVPGSRRLRRGDLVKLDVTVEKEYDARQRDVLTDGLVLTIEPMISAGSRRPVQDRNGWTTRTSDGSLAAHYEHTLVITRDGPVILTAAA